MLYADTAPFSDEHVAKNQTLSSCGQWPNNTPRNNPPDIWRSNNVAITSKRRHFDVITSKWRRFGVIMTSLLCNVSAAWIPSEFHLLQVVLIQFHFMHIEYSSTCKYDNLTVYDGPVRDCSKNCDTYCGTHEGTLWQSSGATAALEFRSDDVYHYDGFMATYSVAPNLEAPTPPPTPAANPAPSPSGCGNVILGGASGTIQSPLNEEGYYLHDLECVWTIEAAPGQVSIGGFNMDANGLLKEASIIRSNYIHQYPWPKPQWLNWKFLYGIIRLATDHGFVRIWALGVRIPWYPLVTCLPLVTDVVIKPILGRKTSILNRLSRC